MENYKLNINRKVEWLFPKYEICNKFYKNISIIIVFVDIIIRWINL